MDIINELAREIKKSSKHEVKNIKNILGLELGTITSSGLKLDNFKYVVKDYMVLDYLKLNNMYATSTKEQHSHTINTPSQLRRLSQGDRVLVALVSGGNELVVVGRVKNA